MLPLLLVSASVIATPIPAPAPEVTVPAPDTPPADAGADQAQHDEPGSEIVVTGAYQRNQQDVLAGTAVVTGTDLARDMKSTIGDTLTSQPGVSATSFGPNASRPVLRGFQGDRAPVLTDGIGSIDVSNTSADHAAVINPLTADRIEVLRGPAALQFSSSAIGGVVNVIDSRIPRRMAEAPLHLDAIASYGSAADERAASATADVPVTGNLLIHMDGSYTKSDDLETGGYLLAPGLRAEAAASPDAEIRALADLRGRLPNSGGRTWDVAGGAAVVDDGGNLGFAFSHYDSVYGVPIRYSLDPAIEAEAVHLHIQQNRVDLRGEVATGGDVIERIRMRLGAADYKHSEIDEAGAIGTTFFNQGYEGRLELVQADHRGWKGAFGGQFFLRDLNVIGDEKFLPKSNTQQLGLFVLQSLDRGALKAEGAARFEHLQVHGFADADLGNPDLTRSFDAVSASLGASYEVAHGIRAGLNASRTERAPTAEELFANGPHAGTQAFEIGNPDFALETSWGLEATLKATGDGWSASASLYQDWIHNYIYDVQTGAVIDGLPVFQGTQADARYFGFEGEGTAKLGTVGGFDVNADLLGDYVEATVDGAGPAPRIPAMRVLGGIEAQSEALNGRLELEHVFDQDRLAINETPTAGYTMLNASLSWKPFADNGTTLTLAADNLFDVVARRHASFLKDYAPLAGRDIRLTARFQL